VWLPNDSVGNQVGFVIGRSTGVVEASEAGVCDSQDSVPRFAVHRSKISAAIRERELFQKIHGVAFDPESRVDRRKLAELLERRSR
jgi:hypothetical protein